MAIASGTAAGVGEQRWGRPFVRVVFLVASFAFLWLAHHQYAAWRAGSAIFELRALDWYTSILAAAGVGFCYSIAAFLPSGRVTFRPLQALVLAFPPAVGILHFAAAVLCRWDLPDVLTRTYFYMEPATQMLLAALVGVALAGGIRRAPDASAAQDPDYSGRRRTA